MELFRSEERGAAMDRALVSMPLTLSTGCGCARLPMVGPCDRGLLRPVLGRFIYVINISDAAADALFYRLLSHCHHR